MAGAKGKKSDSSTMLLDPPAASSGDDELLAEAAQEAADALDELLNESLVQTSALPADVVLVPDDGSAQILASPAAVDEIEAGYKQIDDQLAALTSHVELVTGPAGPLPASDALDAFLADDELAPVFSGLTNESFVEVYGAFTEGVTEVPEWTHEHLAATKEWLAALNDGTLTPAEKYAALSTYADTVRGICETHDVWDELHPALKADTTAWLESLSPSELRQVAHSASIPHPLLLSGGNPHDTSGKNSLAAALNPAWDADADWKKKILTKAHSRYQQLASGQVASLKGVTLADVDADDAAGVGLAVDGPQGSGDAYLVGPSQLAHLQGLANTVAMTSAGQPLKHISRLELAWKLHQAVPQGGVSQADLDALAPIAGNPISAIKHDEYVVAAAQITGHNAEDLSLASPDQFKLLVDPATPAKTVGEVLEEVETTRGVALKLLGQAHTNKMLWESLQDAHLGTAESQANTKTLINGWAEYAALRKQLPPQASLKHGEHADDWAADVSQAGWNGAAAPGDATLRHWLKKQPLSPLRKVAADLGMGDAAAAPTSRTNVQKWVIAHVNGHETKKDDIVAAAKNLAVAKAEAKAAQKSAAAAPPAPAPAAPAAPAAAPAKLKGKAPSFVKPVVTSAQAVGQKIKHVSYAKQLDNLQALLAQAKGASADVPTRNDQQVAAASFVPDASANVSGGSHTTHGYKDVTTGQRYFGKPYGNSGGHPRAVAEAVASQVKEAVGLPAIPCYHRQINGQHMAVQPKIEGVKPLSINEDTSSLSQADVDTIIRNEVGDWLIGDHDGHGGNWLRTPSGALVRCDLGQGFKHFGGDKLAADYKPPANHGTPLFKRVVAAQTSGGLGKDVKVNANVAVGVIRKVESMSPAAFREQLRPVAEAGADNGDIAWVPRMRKVAAKANGIPEGQVTKTQIVDAFLDTAEQRRQTTRQAFRTFFTDAGLDASALDYVA